MRGRRPVTGFCRRCGMYAKVRRRTWLCRECRRHGVNPESERMMEMSIESAGAWARASMVLKEAEEKVNQA